MTLRAWTLAAACLLLIPAAAGAQSGGFGIGPRLTFVRSSDLPEGSQRFSGGAIRLGGGKTALEIAMDFRSGLTGDLTERIKDYPIQGSLLIYPVRAKIAPYLLGGVGWYSQRVERLGSSQTVLEEETTRKMGYHAGFGGELRVHRHIGVYGDYRYTFIRFGGEDPTTPSGAADERPGGRTGFPSWIPFAERLKMSHEGSMFAWGATFYF
jgi:outer membrane protein with beta-barrel domain